MADIGKLLSAVKLQLAIVIVLGIISAAITYMAYSGISTVEDMLALAASPVMLVSSVLWLVGLIVIIWAGYVAAKTVKGGAVDGGLAGALIGVISGIIDGIISLAAIMPLMAKIYAAVPMMSGALASAGAISLVFGIIVAAIIGFILGAIGGFIGRNK
ncbi:MAG: hypothetical protein J4415_02560 [Candidatus Diapherotrites archaeon]|uniref:DUF5518 domain-containing protein n=1 Tax=Candidatus Iainarchaeum sp. TaxID=3101447 RepID=A0A8T4KQU5_9ARCH|nr:hypothetical protein [Candidatus Diapherotrites archaeon]